MPTERSQPDRRQRTLSPPVRLYHFTAEHLLPRIRREGITIGGISRFASDGRFLRVDRGWIWLTADPRFEEQRWCSSCIIPYDRTAVRLAVEIPAENSHRLFLASELLPAEFPDAAFLLEAPGSEAWRVYRGKIFRKWIVEIARRRDFFAPPS